MTEALGLAADLPADLARVVARVVPRRLRPLAFVIGHGTGNDFVLLPDLEGALDLDGPAGRRLVAALCDRRRGVGADGVLRVAPTAAVADIAGLAAAAPWCMDYRNADGSTVEMCGNGVRVVAAWLRQAGHVPDAGLALATRDGVKTVRYGEDGRVTVDMGVPVVVTDDAGAPAYPVDGLDQVPVRVSTGNPHAVFFTPAPSDVQVLGLGPQVEAETRPGGANVEFAAVTGPGAVTMRVWERGVGETASCGTGACAVAVAAAATGRTGRTVTVSLPGGDLDVVWAADGRVAMSGPAVLVGHGVIDDSWLCAALA